MLLTIALVVAGTFLGLHWSRRGGTPLALFTALVHAAVLARLALIHAAQGDPARSFGNPRVLTFGLEAVSLLMIAFRFVPFCDARVRVPYTAGMLLVAILFGSELASIASGDPTPYGGYLYAPLERWRPFGNSRFPLFAALAIVLFPASRVVAVWLGRADPLARALLIASWEALGFALAPELAGLVDPAVGADPRHALDPTAPGLSAGRIVLIASLALFPALIPRLDRLFADEKGSGPAAGPDPFGKNGP